MKTRFFTLHVELNLSNIVLMQFNTIIDVSIRLEDPAWLLAGLPLSIPVWWQRDRRSTTIIIELNQPIEHNHLQLESKAYDTVGQSNLSKKSADS